TMRFGHGDHEHEVSVEYAGESFTARVGDESICVGRLRHDPASGALRGLVGERAFDLGFALDGETLYLFDADGPIRLHWASPLAHAGDAAAEPGGLTAPMPGKVVALLVAAGESVARGQPLVVIEAMKMEHTISAPAGGKVTDLRCGVGEQVAEGAVLVG